jgi:hypothetical protein
VLFDKKMPKELIRLLSKERSRQFYPTGLPLPAPETPPAKPAMNGDPDNPVVEPCAESGMGGSVLNDSPGMGSCVNTTVLPEELLRFLHHWLSLPTQFISQTALFLSAGITSGSKQKKCKHVLQTQGYFIEHITQKGKGKPIMWEPTIKAWEATGIAQPSRASKGGFLHQGFATVIAKSARKKGYQVDIESCQANGKSIDLVLRKEHEVIWIELAMSEPMEKEVSNIRKDFASGTLPDKFVVACKDSKMKSYLLELLAATPELLLFRDKIEVVLAADFAGLE